MRRINITINNKIITKSFEDIDQFRKYIVNDLGLLDFNVVALSVWDLNVGKSYTYCNHRFSIQSKQRIGSQLHDGSTIGKNN